MSPHTKYYCLCVHIIFIVGSPTCPTLSLWHPFLPPTHTHHRPFSLYCSIILHIACWYLDISKEPSVATTGLCYGPVAVEPTCIHRLLCLPSLGIRLVFVCTRVCVRLKFSKIIFRMLALRTHLIVLLIWRSMNKMVFQRVVGAPRSHCECVKVETMLFILDCCHLAPNHMLVCMCGCACVCRLAVHIYFHTELYY